MILEKQGFVLVSINSLKTNYMKYIDALSLANSYTDKLKEREEKGKIKERCLEVRGEELDSMTRGESSKGVFVCMI